MEQDNLFEFSPEPAKCCRMCGECKPISEFNSNGQGYLAPYCKPCHVIYKREWKHKNRESVNAAAMRRYYEDKEKFLERKRRYYKNNRRQSYEQARNWRRNNHERAKANQRRYYDENKELYAESARKYARTSKGRAALLFNNNKRRAAKLQATPVWADEKAISIIYRKAAILRSHGEDMHVDHIIPLQGKTVCGLHVAENLIIIPAAENIRKRNKF